MASPAVMSLRPESQGVQFTARAALRTAGSMSRPPPSRSGRASSIGSIGKYTVDIFISFHNYFNDKIIDAGFDVFD